MATIREKRRRRRERQSSSKVKATGLTWRSPLPSELPASHRCSVILLYAQNLYMSIMYHVI